MRYCSTKRCKPGLISTGSAVTAANLPRYLNKPIIKLIIRATADSERIGLLIFVLRRSLVARGHQHETNVRFESDNKRNLHIRLAPPEFNRRGAQGETMAPLRVNFLSALQRLSAPLKTGICNEWRQFSSQLECLSRLSSPIVLPRPLVAAMNFHEGQNTVLQIFKKKERKKRTQTHTHTNKRTHTPARTHSHTKNSLSGVGI